MAIEKYFTTADEVEKEISASPFWRRSGSGKYTARDYIFSVNFLYAIDIVVVKAEAFPVDIFETMPATEIRKERSGGESWLRIGNAKIYLEHKEKER